MLETIIGLALLPFAIAVAIGLIGIASIVLVNGYKYIFMLLLGLGAVIAYLAQAEWYWTAGLFLASIFAMLWAFGEMSSDAYKKPLESTDTSERQQD